MQEAEQFIPSIVSVRGDVSHVVQFKTYIHYQVLHCFLYIKIVHPKRTATDDCLIDQLDHNYDYCLRNIMNCSVGIITGLKNKTIRREGPQDSFSKRHGIITQRTAPFIVFCGFEESLLSQLITSIFTKLMKIYQVNYVNAVSFHIHSNSSFTIIPSFCAT